MTKDKGMSDRSAEVEIDLVTRNLPAKKSKKISRLENCLANLEKISGGGKAGHHMIDAQKATTAAVIELLREALDD